MAASDARILIVSATHGATPYGICVGYGYQVVSNQVPIRGEGVVGPTAMGEVSASLVAFVEWLVGGGIARNTEANLVLVAKDTGGGNETITLSNMRALGESAAFDRESPPQRFRQELVHVGSFSSSPVAHS